MTQEQAFQILEQATSTIQGDRTVHQAMNEALAVFSELIKPKEETKTKKEK